jgi:hypothetical protein
LCYRETYAPYGDFRFFTLLFVTLNKERVEHICESTRDLPVQLAQYYRLTTYSQAMGDFLGQIWVSRSPSDTQLSIRLSGCRSLSLKSWALSDRLFRACVIRNRGPKTLYSR